MQTPTSPVNLACAQAMKADISSCRTWTNSKRSPARARAPTSPLMPSPGKPKTRRMPQADSLCQKKSLTVLLMIRYLKGSRGSALEAAPRARSRQQGRKSAVPRFASGRAAAASADRRLKGEPKKARNRLPDGAVCRRHISRRRQARHDCESRRMARPRRAVSAPGRPGAARGRRRGRGGARDRLSRVSVAPRPGRRGRGAALAHGSSRHGVVARARRGPGRFGPVGRAVPPRGSARRLHRGAARRPDERSGGARPARPRRFCRVARPQSLCRGALPAPGAHDLASLRRRRVVMNAWLAAAIALLPALGCCLVVATRSGLADRLVALELATAIAVFVLMLLIVAFDQPSFVDLALTLALLSFPGSLVYAHFV